MKNVKVLKSFLFCMRIKMRQSEYCICGALACFPFPSDQLVGLGLGQLLGVGGKLGSRLQSE